MCSDMQDGWAALIHAAVSGKSEVVAELISLGADVDIQTNVSNKSLVRIRNVGYSTWSVCVCLSPLLALQAPNQLMSDYYGSSATSVRKLMWQFL